MLTRKKIEHKFNTTQLISIGFLGIIVIGTIMLMLPFATKEGNSTSLIDALFTATTSVCVTGLTTVSTANHWSLFGKLVILILAQLGGLGVITCATVVMILVKKRITLHERKIIRESYGLDTLEGMVKLIKRIVRGTLFVEGVGVLLYCIAFIPEFGFLRGIWRAVFNSVSAFCNAGMDVLGDVSLQTYCFNPLVNFTTMILIVLGGIGFTVWWDIIGVGRDIKNKKVLPKNFIRRLSLHSKLAITITIFLIAAGAVLIFIFEYGNMESIGSYNIGNKAMASLFQSVTTRTAGFFTIPQDKFTDATAMICLLLMFIGGSPAGTAGGMKTTTIGMLVFTAVCHVKGKKDTEIFKRKIPSDNLRLGLSVVIMGIIALFISVVLLCATQNAPFLDILYEATSAIATVGLSRGLTPELNSIGKIIIIILMYLGRIGPITLVAALAVKKSDKTGSISLPEKRIIVG